MDEDCRSASETILRYRQGEKVSRSAMKAAGNHLRNCHEPGCAELKHTMVGDDHLTSVLQA